MSTKLLLLFLCCVCAAWAQEVTLILTEITLEKNPGDQPETLYREHRHDTAFVIDAVNFTATKSDGAHGQQIAAISKFAVSDRRLKLGDRPLVSADEILAQGAFAGTDVVVVRHSYNSVDPRYWFMALSGHPAQFSEIFIVLSRGDKLQSLNVTSQLHQSNASRWQAAIFEPNAVKNTRP